MPTFVNAGEEVLRRLQVQQVWDLGYDGADVTVAILDSGVNAADIEGPPPIWERDFTGEDNPGDRKPPHGTLVANCVRLIAPKCNLVNAKIVPRRGSTDKAKVAQAVRALGQSGVDIINISLDFDAGGCNPTFRRAAQTKSSVLWQELDRSSACELCLACWDVANSGVAVVSAAGNRWGVATQCPGRSPGSLFVMATTTREEWDYFYRSRSRFRRWWEWHFWGNVGRLFGTSFSAGYASGSIALLMPLVRKHGWLTAKQLIVSGAESSKRTTTTAVDILHRLTAEPHVRVQLIRGGRLLEDQTFEGGQWKKNEALVRQQESERQIVEALEIAEQHQSLAGHLAALDRMGGVEPTSVSPELRLRVENYLFRLHSTVYESSEDIQQLLSGPLDKAIYRWKKVGDDK